MNSTATAVPVDARHRRQLMVDAVADLDMARVHHLVTQHRASVNDIQIAITQTERTHDEVMDAYTAWLDDQAARAVARRAINRVRMWIAQVPLPFEGVASCES